MLFSIIVNTIPLLKDLYLFVTPQYGPDWKVIGTLLGLSSKVLQVIEAAHPTSSTRSCNQMLENWLKLDSTATWKKLFSILESSAVSCSAPDKGD